MKGEGKLECQQASIIEFTRPDSTRLGNVQCQSHWMGKSPIPKTDYVMYFICWVTGGHFTIGWFLLKHMLGGCVQGGRFSILKQTPHSLDREDDQDFVIRCRTYSKRARIESVLLSELSYWIAHSMSILNIMPWRGLEPPRSLARDFESRVSTISPPRHLESDSYSMNMISI